MVAFFFHVQFHLFRLFVDDRHWGTKRKEKGGEEIESDTPAAQPIDCVHSLRYLVVKG